MYDFQSYDTSLLIKWTSLLEQHKGHLIYRNDQWRFETNPYLVYEQFHQPYSDMSVLFKVRQEQLHALYMHLALRHSIKSPDSYSWSISEDYEELHILFKDKILGVLCIDNDYAIHFKHQTTPYFQTTQEQLIHMKTRMYQWLLIIQHLQKEVFPIWKLPRYQHYNTLMRYTPALWLELLKKIEQWTKEDRVIHTNMDIHDLFIHTYAYDEITLIHE